MANSPTLNLTMMSASQAQKEVVFNEFLIAMDALFRGVVINAALSAPPGSPAEGDTYIVATSATGAWSGHDKNVAFYFNGWQFVLPKDYMRLYDQAAAEWRVYHVSTSTWDAEPASTVSVLNDLTNVSGSPTNGQVLTYVLADGKWEPKTLVYPPTALTALTDVTVTEGAGIDGKALAWNNTDAKWEAKAFLTTVPTFMSLTGVNSPGGLANHWIAVYNSSSPGLTFLDPTTIIAVGSLGQVGDVAYPGGGAGAITTGFVLKWNGAAWVPAAETGGGSTTLAADTDVDILTPANGDVLTYQASSGKWINATPSGSSTTLAALTDVNVTEGSGINGYTLNWNNATSKWVATAPVSGGGGSSTLAGDTDVTIASPTNGQVLTYDTASSKWINAAATGGGGGSGYGSTFTPPTVSGLSAVTNLNSATLTDRTSGVAAHCLHIKPGTAGTSGTLYCVLEAAPAGDFSLVAKIEVSLFTPTGDTNQGAGLVVKDTGGNIIFLNVTNDYYNRMSYMTNSSGYAMNANALLRVIPPVEVFMHMDFVASSNTVTLGLSRNGKDAVHWFSTTSIITSPSNVGIGWTGPSATSTSGGTAGPEYDVVHYHSGALGTNGL